MFKENAKGVYYFLVLNQILYIQCGGCEHERSMYRHISQNWKNIMGNFFFLFLEPIACSCCLTEVEIVLSRGQNELVCLSRGMYRCEHANRRVHVKYTTVADANL